MDIISKIEHIYRSITFISSKNYWINRYRMGENSGNGSYGLLAEYKANIINDFVKTNEINTIIEFGCGDGHQLTLAKYPHYLGYDISPDAIILCKKLFANDPYKSFDIMDKYNNETAELSLSLDVLYHLCEDDVFQTYMNTLFRSSSKYVIIYSTDYEEKIRLTPHVKHRHFTKWVNENLTKWTLISHLSNIHSEEKSAKDRSKADFFIYKSNSLFHESNHQTDPKSNEQT